jgi:hypothetical protein
MGTLPGMGSMLANEMLLDENQVTPAQQGEHTPAQIIIIQHSCPQFVHRLC